MQHKVLVMPREDVYIFRDGENLLAGLRSRGVAVDAPCGGNGRCGKCALQVNGEKVLSCHYAVTGDITVTLPEAAGNRILTNGSAKVEKKNPLKEGLLVAVDIGTTTVVCALLSEQGETLAVESCVNPQTAFGADVVSRIQCAVKGEREALTRAIRTGLTELIEKCCHRAGVSPEEIGVVSVVGNSCMQQLFLGLDVNNLATVPFAPVLTETAVLQAADYLPNCTHAVMPVVPDIAGFVGADTMGCILAAQMHREKRTVLLVDIGTNGEMVLCSGGKLTACSTAAGPALEGANISCGMRAAEGAIDFVGPDGIRVIGGGEAKGICGSGLISAVGEMLRTEKLNFRGRILTEDHTYPLTSDVVLTQDDIRQLQLAKGAIAAGIEMMLDKLDLTAEDVDECILAGAFGSYLDPESACRMGLLPAELLGKITVGGNLAFAGAKMLALDGDNLSLTEEILSQVDYIDLSADEDFMMTFAMQMYFPNDEEDE